MSNQGTCSTCGAAKLKRKPTAKAPKPSLTGVKLKQRKGAAKAAAKFEPNAFRDTLLKHLEGIPPTDFDGFAKKLDELGSQLDYRKYEQELFQLLLVGHLLAPGGGFVKDGAEVSPFSLITSATKENPIDLGQIKAIVDVFNKLLRRYKYLQKDFEEASLPAILQHVNKFDSSEHDNAASHAGATNDGTSTPNTPGAMTPVLNKNMALPNLEELSVNSNPPSRPQTPAAGVILPSSPRPNQDKLAAATALFVAQGLVAPTILVAARKDHLIKDGTALAFLTVYIRTYLSVESIEHLATSLRRGGVSDLLDFFPASRRTVPEFTTYFKGAKLDSVAELFQKQRSAEISKETLAHVKEMVAGSESNEEIISYLKSQERTKTVSEPDFIALVWHGLMSTVDVAGSTPQASEQVLREIKDTAPVLEAFCTSARAEVALINTIQGWCHENTAMLGVFVKILMTLYNADVLSSDAIIYWHSKGSKPQARQHFLKAAEPLVKKLREAEEEEEDDD